MAFSQIRRRGDGEDAAIVAVVGRLRGPARVHYEIAEPAGGQPARRAEGLHARRAPVLVAALTTLPDRAANGDIVRSTWPPARKKQVTVDGDYDEDISFSPDQRWYVVASGRGRACSRPCPSRRRPNFIGPAFEPLTAYLFAHHRGPPGALAGPRWCRAERRAGPAAQPPIADEGYDGRTLMTWHLAGDRILFWEGQGDPFAPDGAASRIVVAHLPSRDAEQVACPMGTVADLSPVPRWAPGSAACSPPPFPLVESLVRRTLQRRPTGRPAAGQTVVEVVYGRLHRRRRVDRRRHREQRPLQAHARRRTAPPTSRCPATTPAGCADAVISVGAIDGTITSSVDGRELRLPVR